MVLGYLGPNDVQGKMPTQDGRTVDVVGKGAGDITANGAKLVQPTAHGAYIYDRYGVDTADAGCRGRRNADDVHRRRAPATATTRHRRPRPARRPRRRPPPSTTAAWPLRRTGDADHHDDECQTMA